MLKLEREYITISDSSTNKNEAIREVASLLEKNGFVKGDYVDGMFEREKQISTYLENGIAIPHGTPEKKEAVLKTGVQVIFYPKGIDWDNGNRVRLVVGIAASSNEHLDILRALTHSVMDKDLNVKLDNVKTVDDIYTLFTEARTESSSETKGILDGISETFTLKNAQGLHARPCAELVKIVKRFESDVLVSNLDGSDNVVNGKSMMKLMSLGVKSGHRLTFIVNGPDEKEALEAIGKGIEEGLGEPV